MGKVDSVGVVCYLGVLFSEGKRTTEEDGKFYG